MPAAGLDIWTPPAGARMRAASCPSQAALHTMTFQTSRGTAPTLQGLSAPWATTVSGRRKRALASTAAAPGVCPRMHHWRNRPGADQQDACWACCAAEVAPRAECSQAAPAPVHSHMIRSCRPGRHGRGLAGRALALQGGIRPQQRRRGGAEHRRHHRLLLSLCQASAGAIII